MSGSYKQQYIRTHRFNNNNPEDMVLCFIIALIIVLLIIALFLCKSRNHRNISSRQSTSQNPYIVHRRIGYQIQNSLFDYNSDNVNYDICTICLEELKSNEQNLIITKCNHIFHKDCLLKWININSEKRHNTDCPNCKYNIINVI